MNKVNDKGNFAQGKISSAIIRLSLPIMLAEFIQILYNLVDRMFIGHIPGYGTQALTGIGIVFPLISLTGAFCNLCSYGGTSLCSISRGQKNDSQAQALLENTFTLIIIYSLILTSVILVFKKPILYALGADEQTYIYAKEYAQYYFIGTVFVMISTGMNGFINLQGFPTKGMLTVIIGAVLNIILDPVFIFVLNMGVKGAAIATVIAQCASAVWVIIFLTSEKPPVRLQHLRLEKPNVKHIHQLGVSGFAFKSTNSITQAIANSTLMLFGGVNGSLYIASMSIINQLREVTNLPVTAMTEGAKPVMGYNYGAKEYKRTEKTIWFILKTGFCMNALIWFVFMFFPEPLVRIFTSDSMLIENCIPALRIYYCVYFMMTFQMTGQNTFVALNKPKYAVFFAVFRKLILILPCILILPRIGFGAKGVFMAEAISQVIGSIACFTTMYFTVIKKLRKNQQNII